jgi:hypothetical protein
MGVKIRLLPKGKSTHRLKVFENKKVLRRTFGIWGQKLQAKWRQIHNGSFIICPLNHFITTKKFRNENLGGL